MKIDIYAGDCLDSLKKLEDQSINTCITSPPYWGLRDYGTAEWEGGNPDCDHVANPNATKKMGNEEFNKNRPSRESTKTKGYYEKECPKCGAIKKDSQLGMEDTPEEFVDNLVAVFKEVKRVLRDDGTVWLNLADSYVSGKSRYSTREQTLAGGGKNEKKLGNLQRGGKKDLYGHPFYKDKDLAGIPWAVAFALRDRVGLYLRQDIIWHKPNTMPESVRDRCTKAHEYIFLFSKSKKYYYDNEAIKEDSVTVNSKGERGKPNSAKNVGKSTEDVDGFDVRGGFKNMKAQPKRNKRSVWTVATKPFAEAHFATFPPKLIEPCVLAGCPEKMCVDCGKPYKRVMKQPKQLEVKRGRRAGTDDRLIGGVLDKYKRENPPIDLGLQKQCDCKTNETKAGTVLDPFGGSGTTAEVSNAHARDTVLCELSDDYIEIAVKRLSGMFADINIIKEKE